MKTRKHILFLLLVMVISLYVRAQQPPDQPDKIIKTYPNPATSFITFEFTRSYDRSYAIQIFNFTGKKMFDGTNLLVRTTIPLQNFYRGVYLYRLIDRNGKVIESGKFQVVK